MYSFRRLVVLLALLLPVAPIGFAEESSSSSSARAQDSTAQGSTAQDQAGQNQAGQNQAQASESNPNQSVQARIKARREQRRIQAIHDTYTNLYEILIGGGYLRFRPGPDIQLLTMYSWDAAITRYFNPKLGVTVDGRGYYGTAYVGLNEASVTRPAISQYGVLAGPTYRFILHPKYSVSGRVMGGVALSNFGGDTNGFSPQSLGLYPDGTTYAVNAALFGEYNLSPGLSLRLGPDYYLTGFGSTTQNSVGFTYGLVYRFGKQ
jgi:hypothetical protein